MDLTPLLRPEQKDGLIAMLRGIPREAMSRIDERRDNALRGMGDHPAPVVHFRDTIIECHQMKTDYLECLKQATLTVVNGAFATLFEEAQTQRENDLHIPDNHQAQHQSASPPSLIIPEPLNDSDSDDSVWEILPLSRGIPNRTSGRHLIDRHVDPVRRTATGARCKSCRISDPGVTYVTFHRCGCVSHLTSCVLCVMLTGCF
jgi:hypothetical protein